MMWIRACSVTVDNVDTSLFKYKNQEILSAYLYIDKDYNVLSKLKQIFYTLYIYIFSFNDSNISNSNVV